jgi:hypothetical protein
LLSRAWPAVIHHWPFIRTTIRRAALLGSLLLIIPGSAAFSAGGSTIDRVPEDTITPQDEAVSPGLQPVMKGEIRFTGMVLDKHAKPLPGVQVRLYVNGVATHTATTDHVGQYNFRVHMNTTGKETIAVWFQDPSGKLTPKALVLAENAACREAKLLSKCYPRIAFQPVVESRVHLFDKDTRAQQLVATDCL